jgi:hypothetical protein
VLLAIIPCLTESLVVLTYKTVRPLLVNASMHVSWVDYTSAFYLL